MTRPGIEPETSHSRSGHATTRLPGLSSDITIKYLLGNLESCFAAIPTALLASIVHSFAICSMFPITKMLEYKHLVSVKNIYRLIVSSVNTTKDKF